MVLTENGAADERGVGYVARTHKYYTRILGKPNTRILKPEISKHFLKILFKSFMRMPSSWFIWGIISYIHLIILGGFPTKKNLKNIKAETEGNGRFCFYEKHMSELLIFLRN